MQVGIATADIESAAVPSRNLVFLLDVSGSMSSPDKLGLVTRGLELLVRELRSSDAVAVVTYAGASGVVLPPTSGRDQVAIRAALSSLRADGATNGASGIVLAYRLARSSFKKGAINRVILATDGDFNVGLSSEAELVRLVEQERKSGVFLTVLGVGRGNLKDSTMEMLADKGNGNYAYLDSLAEAEKVLVRESGATLHTIAQDVKFQVEFNPRLVKSYRLLGYENRRLAAQDFNDDTKDAGELGAGHQVTALYEIIPRQSEGSQGVFTGSKTIDPLKYQFPYQPTPRARASELGTLKVRYKLPEGSVSRKFELPIFERQSGASAASPELQFALGLAQWGMLLVDSEYRGSSSYQGAYSGVKMGSRGNRERLEALRLIQRAAALAREEAKESPDSDWEPEGGL